MIRTGKRPQLANGNFGGMIDFGRIVCVRKIVDHVLVFKSEPLCIDFLVLDSFTTNFTRLA